MRVRALLTLLAFIALGLAGLALSRAAAAAEPTPPGAALNFINDIGSRTIGVLADRTRTPAERETRVKVLLDEGLDLNAIGRFALGRFWQTASDAQRAQYDKIFHDYVLNTYARRLAAYSGETFKVVGVQPIAGTDALVSTTIERPANQPANVGWRVRAEGGRFKVVDVVVEGVSMALTQRQEFASVVANKGFDGLLDSMRSQLQQYAASTQ